MYYTLKARCQGCIALQSGEEFTCLFGLPLMTTDINEEPTQPSPNEVKCYKPKTKEELKEAKVLMEKRTVNA